MADLPVHIQNASFEAHMSASENIASAQGVERAELSDVVHALANAYGEALGLFAMTGATNDQLATMGRAVSEASKAMIAKVHVQTCEGLA